MPEDPSTQHAQPLETQPPTPVGPGGDRSADDAPAAAFLHVGGQPVPNAFGFSLSFAADGRGGSFPVLYWQGGRVTTPWSIALRHAATPHSGSSGVAPWQGDPPQRYVCAKRLLQLLEEWRAAGKTIVVANGCFDVFHAGHASLLAEAKRQGDILIVLVNSDESIRRLKGPTRPVCTLADRVAVLEAIRCVDAVVDFTTDTPEQLIASIRPEVLVKGKCAAGAPVPGSIYAGRVHFAPMLSGRSSTHIVELLGVKP